MSRKIKTIVAAVGAVGVFSTGALLGNLSNDYASVNLANGAANLKSNENVEQSTKIAIVNLDDGAWQGKYNGDGSRLIENFSKQILDAYDLDSAIFENTTAESAKKGLSTNKYGAVITIGHGFSENIISNINKVEPDTVPIQYETAENLTESNSAKVQANVQELTNMINIQISYLYVSNVFTNVHQGQDYASEVMSRDDTDLKALDSVSKVSVPEVLNKTTTTTTEETVDKKGENKNPSAQPEKTPAAQPETQAPEVPGYNAETQKNIANQINNYYKDHYNSLQRELYDKLSSKDNSFNSLMDRLNNLESQLGPKTPVQVEPIEVVTPPAEEGDVTETPEGTVPPTQENIEALQNQIQTDKEEIQKIIDNTSDGNDGGSAKLDSLSQEFNVYRALAEKLAKEDPKAFEEIMSQFTGGNCSILKDPSNTSDTYNWEEFKASLGYTGESSKTPEDKEDDKKEDNETPAETPGDAAEDTSAETPDDTVEETPSDTPAEIPDDTAEETPSDTPAETPDDAAEETPSDTPAETPDDAAEEAAPSVEEAPEEPAAADEGIAPASLEDEGIPVYSGEEDETQPDETDNSAAEDGTDETENPDKTDDKADEENENKENEDNKDKKPAQSITSGRFEKYNLKDAPSAEDKDSISAEDKETLSTIYENLDSVVGLLQSLKDDTLQAADKHGSVILDIEDAQIKQEVSSAMKEDGSISLTDINNIFNEHFLNLLRNEVGEPNAPSDGEQTSPDDIQIPDIEGPSESDIVLPDVPQQTPDTTVPEIPEITDEELPEEINQLLNQQNDEVTKLIEKQVTEYTEKLNAAGVDSQKAISDLMNNINTGIDEIQKSIVSSMEDAKNTKLETQKYNKEKLGAFTDLLKNTRAGSVENEKVYKYVSDPLSKASNLSFIGDSGQKGNEVGPDQKDTSKGTSSKTFKMMLIVCVLLSAIIEGILLSMKKRNPEKQ